MFRTGAKIYLSEKNILGLSWIGTLNVICTKIVINLSFLLIPIFNICILTQNSPLRGLIEIIVLYCTVLYCIVLYCIALCCVVLRCVELRCVALHCTVL